jgi:hypothetical protein
MTGGAIPFRKMNGLGNEFIVFDARQAPVRLSPIAIRSLGQQDAIGFDQMITIERSAKNADAFMRIHNRLRQRHALHRLAVDGRDRPQDRDHRDQRRAAPCL